MTYEITTHDVITIPLSKLIASGLNARKMTTSPESNAELKASLYARGVLENLIVYDADKGRFAVAAGERRRGMLKALAKEKKIPVNFPVPCIVRPEDVRSLWDQTPEGAEKIIRMLDTIALLKSG